MSIFDVFVKFVFWYAILAFWMLCFRMLLSCDWGFVFC